MQDASFTQNGKGQKAALLSARSVKYTKFFVGILYWNCNPLRLKIVEEVQIMHGVLIVAAAAASMAGKQQLTNDCNSKYIEKVVTNAYQGIYLF